MGTFQHMKTKVGGMTVFSLYSVEIIVSIKGIPRILGGGYTVNNL